jgi:metal-responsive CopG/Arc/MetJ family transcriptional regulator
MAQQKTAISIDDSVFEAMEDVANRMSISRSRAFELAARQFVKRYREELVTAKLNKVYGDKKDKDDDFLEAMFHYQTDVMENFE